MTIAWTPTGDLSSIADGAAPIAWRRRGETVDHSIDAAIRSQIRESDPLATQGRLFATEAIWTFEPGPNELAPTVGDVLIDEDAQPWSILQVDAASLAGAYRCEARRWALRRRPNDLVAVQQAEWNNDGTQIIGWTTIRSALPAAVVPLAVAADRTADSWESTATTRVFLLDAIRLTHHHRLVSSRGDVFQVDSYRRVSDLEPIAEVGVTLA